MADLEFRIGKLDIKPDRGISENFVIENKDNVISIYACLEASHAGVVVQYGLNNDNIVGGGYVSLEKNQVALNGFSGSYGTIPKKAAEKFAELVAEELRKQGLLVEGYIENVSVTDRMNGFWDNYKDIA